MSEINNNNFTQNEEQSSINLTELLFKMLAKWHLFAISVIIMVAAFFIFSKFTTPQYEAKGTLLIKSNENALSQLTMISNSFGQGTKSNFQNEIGQIQSYEMTKRTVKALDFYVSYYSKNNFKTLEIYNDSPFEVEIDFNKAQTVNIPINFKILSDKEFEISYSDKDDVEIYDYAMDEAIDKRIKVKGKETKLKFGEWYEENGMRFRAFLKADIEVDKDLMNNSYYFELNNMDAIAKRFNTTDVSLLNKESTIINIVFKYPNQQKAIDFINMLCKIYIDMTFEEKNYIHTSTIQFVDAQISNIADSLNIAERKREDFQVRNKTIDLSTDAKFLFDKANELESKRAEEFTKQQYYEYLAQYLKQADMDAGVVAPAVMGVEDMLLNKLVQELASKLSAKKSLEMITTKKNVAYQQLEGEIDLLKKQIEENVRSLKKVNTIATNEITRQLKLFQAELDKLPSTQRNMINIERQFKFNDEIYNFLYQKRAEAEIAKNSALPDHKIIDKARTAIKVYPKTALNLMIGFLVGLLIPGLYIFIRFTTNNVIESRKDLEKISSSPIIGYVPALPEDTNKLIVFSKPKSQITESFRAIRTNLKYIIGGGKNQIILISSAMPGDGKSFVSMNLASVISMGGNKTIIIGYDLRKPKLHTLFEGMKNTAGVTTYLIGKHSLDEVIQKTKYENLDILPSGPIPPNPSELIDSEENAELINKLKERYDAIIFDTPPISLITDAVTLTKHSDINIIIARSGKTNKRIFESTIYDLEQRDKIKINYILNDISNSGHRYGYGRYGSYGGYGYGYGNGYGYGYFEDDEKNS